MDPVLEFRLDIAKGYLAGKIPQVGFHGTYGAYRKSQLRRQGLKHFPKRHKCVLMELGVHYLAFAKSPKQLTLQQVLFSLDQMGATLVSYDPEKDTELREEPGLVVLSSRVPRSRSNGGRFSLDGEIYDQRYVPVLPKSKDWAHTLIAPKLIRDIVYLSQEETDQLVMAVNGKYGSPAFLTHLVEVGAINERQASVWHLKREQELGVKAGRLLMYKAREFFV